MTTDTTTIPTPCPAEAVTVSGQIGRTLQMVAWLDQHRPEILDAEGAPGRQMSVRFDPSERADLRLVWSTWPPALFEDVAELAGRLGLVYAGSSSGGPEHGSYVHHSFVGAPEMGLFVTLAWLQDVAR